MIDDAAVDELDLARCARSSATTVGSVLRFQPPAERALRILEDGERRRRARACRACRRAAACPRTSSTPPRAVPPSLRRGRRRRRRRRRSRAPRRRSATTTTIAAATTAPARSSRRSGSCATACPIAPARLRSQAQARRGLLESRVEHDGRLRAPRGRGCRRSSTSCASAPRRSRRRRRARGRAAPLARQAARARADRPARRPRHRLPRAERARGLGGLRRPGARRGNRHRDRRRRGPRMRDRRERRDGEGRLVLPAHRQEAPARAGGGGAERAALHLPRRLGRRVPAAAGRGVPGPRPLRTDLLQPGADVGQGHPADRGRDGLVHGRRRVRAGDERRDGDRAAAPARSSSAARRS